MVEKWRLARERFRMKWEMEMHINRGAAYEDKATARSSHQC